MDIKSSKKIAMVVLNSVSHDARVKKMAESLSKSGFIVHIFGIQDKRDSRFSNKLPNGTKIIRVDISKITKIPWIILHQIKIIILFILFLIPYVFFLYKPYIEGFNLSKDGLFSINLMIVTTVYIISIFVYFLQQKLLLKRISKNSLSKKLDSNKRSSNGFFDDIIIYLKILRESLTNVISLFNPIKRIISSVVKRYLLYEILETEISKMRPHFVHCHDLPTLPIGWRIKNKLYAKLIYDSHEIFEHVSQFNFLERQYYIRLQKYYSKYVDYFITINESIRKYLNYSYPKLPKGVVIKNATPYLDNLKPYDGRLHKKSGFDPSIRILLYQGGFSKFRGLEKLIYAAPLLKDGWGVVMMGWGTIEEELKSLAKSIDPDKNKIRFIPGAPHRELVYWTQGASLGIIPYENICLNHWYCTPNKLWEYPNAGVPVLVSSFPEMKINVIENDIGWLLGRTFSSETISYIVNKISDKDLKLKAENCRKFVSEDNWLFYEERLKEIYQN